MNANSTPDEIRAEIDRTRAALSDDVDTLTDTANPKNIAKRQANRVSERARAVKEKIMGAVEHHSEGQGGGVRDTLSHAGSTVGDAVSSAPEEIKRQARGNPLAAGLVVFGLGLLVSSLIPPSRAERETVANMQGEFERIKSQASDAAKEAADHLREPAQQAAESVKSTLQGGVQDVSQEGQRAKDRVQSQAEHSADSVRNERS